MKTMMVEPVARGTGVTRCTALDFTTRAVFPRAGLAYPTRLDPERLARSLARVLADYGLFSGQLRCPKQGSMYIEHGRRAVPFEVDESDDSAVALVERAEAEGSRLIAPQISRLGALTGSAPLMAARLTHTRDGSVLGVTWNHAVGDLGTAVTFVSAWASAYREQDYPLPIEIEDRVAFWNEQLQPDLAVGSDLKLASFGDIARFVSVMAKGSRRVQVDLDRADLAAMRSAAGGRASSDEALAAHVALAVQALRRRRSSSRLIVALDLRPRLRLPPLVLGNMTGVAKVAVEPDDDVPALAARLGAALRGPVSDYFAVHQSEAFAAAHAKRSQRWRYWPPYLDLTRGDLVMSIAAGVPYQRLTFEPGAPLVRFFGALEDLAMQAALVFHQPQAGLLSRQVILWLPPPAAECLSGPAGRSRLLDAGASTARASQRDDRLEAEAQPRIL